MPSRGSGRSRKWSSPCPLSSTRPGGGPRRKRGDWPVWKCWTSSTSRRPPRWPSAISTASSTSAPAASEKPLRVLVYDLGGGTFDVTVLEIAGTQFRALATDGDVQLGGRDFDERLVSYLAEQFQAAHGVDPRERPARRRPALARRDRGQASRSPNGPRRTSSASMPASASGRRLRGNSSRT